MSVPCQKPKNFWRGGLRPIDEEGCSLALMQCDLQPWARRGWILGTNGYPKPLQTLNPVFRAGGLLLADCWQEFRF